MDNNTLMNIINEKDKRIQDLERQVEDQKRLRLQDSNQVEEKAAKIKEWVTNKLMELESQNRQLRDQNRKQKETVENLTVKLATLSPVSTPRRKNLTLERFQDIHSSDSAENDYSTKPRRLNGKKLSGPLLSSQEDANKALRSRLNSFGALNSDESNKSKSKLGTMASFVDSNGRSVISIGSKSSGKTNPNRQDSPLYDCVNLDQSRANQDRARAQSPKNSNENMYELANKVPPPLPPHQTNKWELQLYSLADQTVETLKQRQPVLPTASINETHDSLEYASNDGETSISRKSSTSSKNELISLVRPSFTTIDGDQVIEEFVFQESSEDSSTISNDKHKVNSAGQRSSNDGTSQSSAQLSKPRNESFDSQDNIERSMTQNLFDSPMRCRNGRENNILRTQSVRKNPAPEKLYEFFSADLVKRGYLTKTGALKNHQRWIVLKNFTLHAFKQESDEALNNQASTTLKLNPNCQIVAINQTSTGNYPFKITYQDKSLSLIADTIQTRDEWFRILTMTIKLSDVEPDSLKKKNSTYEGLVTLTRHGHSKRCHAVLINHIIFFLKSPIDPSPTSYLPVKESKVREITDNQNYDSDDSKLADKSTVMQDCSLAIYPKYSMDLDPVYISLGSQQETDAWLYFLAKASGVDQSHGTPYERALTREMINNNPVVSTRRSVDYSFEVDDFSRECQSDGLSIMLSTDQPITQPLTSLPNETLRMEAIELFKSILLFTQVPLQPVAIDYHVCLLQNCLGRFLKRSELRNEFFAQLIKQSTISLQRCPSLPIQSELIQIMQILAVAVSLSLPRGRVKSYLTEHLRKFADTDTDIGKYALYTLRAIDRTGANGTRDFVPSRLEIMSILLRNPYDHSKPHSLPVNFSDGSYIVVEADGSTTMEEFMNSMSKSIDVRHSSLSDFYLFADDPTGLFESHILEPQRKVLDVVGWWEQTFKQNNSGRCKNTKVIKIMCKKRLLLRTEAKETEQERLLILHQINQEIITQHLPLSDLLSLELAAIMAQLTFGDYDESKDQKFIRCLLDKVQGSFLPPDESFKELEGQLKASWTKLAGKTSADCIRVYLNCIRRIKLEI